MFRKEIVKKTFGEIRSFLDEIVNDTSRYRSLHNLTEQVEHQYHGRFLIELIQNAHDALFETEDANTPQRIEIVLEKDEHPHGALYIANDGKPFTSSNFKALSTLGQSNKDPQQSIGNKGIGFRSVLEITKAPEIYSRSKRGRSSFDGYCFAFQPDMIQKFEDEIRRVIESDNNMESSRIFGEKFLEWDDKRHKDFRALYRERSKSNKEWLGDELKFLSPYALPIPLDTQKTKLRRVMDFEQRGFSTVIRLPFYNNHAEDICTEKLDEINESTAIFLHRVNVLQLSTKNHNKCYKREQKPLNDDRREGFEVQITVEGSDVQERQSCCSLYWLWKRTVGGERRPIERDKIQSAVADLPGKWPEVDEASVEIAVQVGNEPDDGLINIYLPTQVPSGCAAHFSAPFYGDMSRTNIDFENPLNSFLLRTIAEKGVDIILGNLSGRGEAEAAAIIDILAPIDSSAGQRWWNALEEVFSNRDIEIENQDIALSDEGWHSFACTSLLPNHESNTVINASLLRSEATYPVFVPTLQERENGIKRIFEKIKVDHEASSEDKAATLEAIAKRLHESQQSVDWNGFWKEVKCLFEDAEPLIGKKVLLGTDNMLHSSDDQCSVFFRPSRSGSDDEVSEHVEITDIPEKLRPFIAFLNEDIQTHTPRAKGGVYTTAVQQYLQSTGLVHTYGVERIFSSVLVKATPKSPHNIDGHESKLCRDILKWGLRLIQASKHSMDEPIRLLGKLLAPCIGGWYPINKTSFGAGWPGKSGDKLEVYLRRTSTPECSIALKCLLLPSNHPLWGEMGSSSAPILEKAGAFNGIRLLPLKSNDWEAKFIVAGWKGVKLPEKGPKSYSSDVWSAYRKYIDSTENYKYWGEFEYEMQDVHALPGFEKIDDFDDETHKLLMELLLDSIPSWNMQGISWKKVKIRKLSGNRHEYKSLSPLAFSLRETKWMQSETGDETIRFRPTDRWHVPSFVQKGGIRQFSHLMPMPVLVSSILDKNQDLVESMRDIGMPVYDPEDKTADPRLLNDLAAALDDPSTDISNRSVFLGQIRDAWSLFYPNEEELIPDKIIVQNGPKSQICLVPSEDKPVYLPDGEVTVHKELELHSKPVVVMRRKDANRLKEHFQNVCKNGVRLVSEMGIKPFVDNGEWQSKNDSLRLSEELPWLIKVILSIYAFAGDQSQGTSTKTFKEAIYALRKARIEWVPTLEAELLHENVSIARTDRTALWLSRDNTLLVVEEDVEKGKLSRELASIVGRNDISESLTAVLFALLNDFDIKDEISEDAVCASLDEVNITSDNYQEIKQCWLGDLAWSVSLVKPLILLMQPEADLSLLDEISSEEQFRDTLQSYNTDPLDSDCVLSIVRDASGLKSVGRKIWDILGDQAQLNQWNKVLSQINESPVVNDQAKAEFSEHMNSCLRMMHSIIRYTIRKNPDSRGFKDLGEDLLKLECPDKYAKNYWSVGFPQVMKKVCGILVKWGTDSDVITIVESVESAEELRNQLDQLDLSPNLNSIEIHADNRKIFFDVLEEVREFALAWCIKEKADAGMWEQDNDNFEKQLEEDFSKTAFIDTWDEAICIKMIGKLNRLEEHEGFWALLDKISTVNELKGNLGISDTDMDDARNRHKERERNKEITKKLVEVCGKNFINSEKNLSNLWDHIIENSDVRSTNLDYLEKLVGTEKPKKTSGKKDTTRTIKRDRMSQADKNLVGLAGEIHAFLALQKYYGIETVGPENWISENSRYQYPENTTDDTYGCDFKIHKDGKTYYVEVKSTQSDDKIFELGSSEVRLAIDSANRRKKQFIVIHVLHAFSKNPELLFLRNPYDRQCRDKYKFENAGLRVRYKVADEPGKSSVMEALPS